MGRSLRKSVKQKDPQGVIMKRRITARENTCDTIIEFILDQTGSMCSCHNETVLSFNDFLKEQKSQTGKCLLTLTKFDSYKNITPYTDLDIQIVPEMFSDWFIPGGTTNLRDTIGERIDALEKRLENWTQKPKVLIVVMTDGGDNASRAYTETQISSKLKIKNTDGWTFVYLGIDQNALDIGSRLGFRAENIKSFARSDLTQSMAQLSRATTAFRAASTTQPFFNQEAKHVV